MAPAFLYSSSCAPNLVDRVPLPHLWALLQGSRGFTARVPESQQHHLRTTLVAARHMIAESLGSLPLHTTAADLLPDMLQGKVQPGTKERHGVADLSGFLIAVLWVGSTLSSVGELPLPISTYTQTSTLLLTPKFCTSSRIERSPEPSSLTGVVGDDCKPLAFASFASVKQR